MLRQLEDISYRLERNSIVTVQENQDKKNRAKLLLMSSYVSNKAAYLIINPVVGTTNTSPFMGEIRQHLVRNH